MKDAFAELMRRVEEAHQGNPRLAEVMQALEDVGYDFDHAIALLHKPLPPPQPLPPLKLKRWPLVKDDVDAFRANLTGAPA